MRKNIDNIRFGCWVPPMPEGNYGVPGSFITVERYREAKEMGLDFVIGHMEKGPDDPNVKKALKCADATGLGYILRWEDMINYADSSPEELKKALGETLDAPALMGVLVRDEPNVKEFPKMGKLASLFRKISDKYFYVNLFPWDAGEELLGTPTYAEHLDAFRKNLKNDMVSMDIYPLRRRKGGVYYVSDCFLRNLEEIGNMCAENKMEHWQFVQGSMAYGISKAPDYFDMRFQMYASLCYGATVFQYYCYCTPNLPFIIKKKKWTSMLDYYGNKTSRYFAAQRLCTELHSLGKEYMKFARGWQGVMPINGKGAELNPAFALLETPLKKADGIVSVTAERDAIAGVFKNGEGETAYVITDYTVPAYRNKNRLEIKFANARAVVVYRKGKRKTYGTEDGVFTLTLSAGEGVFVMPVKG